MISYKGRHAEFYDIFYRDKPYKKEAAFIHQCLQECSIGKTKRLLELACGTGTHALALEKFNYEIIATDNSEDMLNHARRKAAMVDSAIDFRPQDMRELSLDERPFDAVFCLFDSIGYLKTNEKITEAFLRVRDHLRKDGLFIFEFWHAPAMLTQYEPVRFRRWVVPDGQLVRISETTLDYVLQTASVRYTIYELLSDGTYHGLEEVQENRFFHVQEMANLISYCDYTPIKFLDCYTDNEDISEKTWHILAIIRKGR